MRVCEYGRALILCILVASCAPPPSSLVKLVPLPEKDDIVLGPENRSVSLREGGVTISVSGLDPQELAKYNVVLKPVRPEDFDTLFKAGYVNYAAGDNAELLSRYRLAQTYPRELRYDAFGRDLGADGWVVNPYLEKKDQILIFRISIDNKSAQKVELDPAQCVLVDDQRRQYAVLSKDEWHGFCPLIWSPNYAMVTYGRSYQLVNYFVPREVLIKDNIVEATLLQAKKIFPGVAMEGLVVFPLMPNEVQEIKLILPEITFYNENNEAVKKKDFAYRFKIVRPPSK
jgi:hypothetical protein